MELEQHVVNEYLEDIPRFELSYETTHHKKDSNFYDICTAIPFGRKTICWFSHTADDNLALFFDLNRDKQLGRCTQMKHDCEMISYTTIIYGTMINDEETGLKYFVVEDIFWYCGINVGPYLTYEKWYLMNEVVTQCQTMFEDYGLYMFMPFMWKSENCDGILPRDLRDDIFYNVHHLQYRSQNVRAPFYNVPVNKNFNYTAKKKSVIPQLLDYKCEYQMDLQKPQYRQKSVFIVKADFRADVYHLFAYGKNKRQHYYGVGYVPNYETSVRLNTTFRNIKENRNLDAIEESDDEDDFQDMRFDKYVDLKKEVPMFCTFSRKFRKWVITNPAPRDMRVVHIGRLVRDFV